VKKEGLHPDPDRQFFATKPSKPLTAASPVGHAAGP